MSARVLWFLAAVGCGSSSKGNCTALEMGTSATAQTVPAGIEVLVASTASLDPTRVRVDNGKLVSSMALGNGLRLVVSASKDFTIKVLGAPCESGQATIEIAMASSGGVWTPTTKIID